MTSVPSYSPPINKNRLTSIAKYVFLHSKSNSEQSYIQSIIADVETHTPLEHHETQSTLLLFELPDETIIKFPINTSFTSGKNNILVERTILKGLEQQHTRSHITTEHSNPLDLFTPYLAVNDGNWWAIQPHALSTQSNAEQKNKATNLLETFPYLHSDDEFLQPMRIRHYGWYRLFDFGSHVPWSFIQQEIPKRYHSTILKADYTHGQ